MLDAGEMEFAEQFMHPTVAINANEPAAHDVQSPEPTASLYEPAAHATHVLLLLSSRVYPVLQKHTSAAVSEYMPSPHCLQLDVLSESARYVPGAHSVHLMTFCQVSQDAKYVHVVIGITEVCHLHATALTLSSKNENV